MELLKDVLIKEVDGTRTGDKVFFVDNLPKSLIYQTQRKQIIDYTDPQNRQQLVPDFKLNDAGRKVPTGAMEDVLLPGIEFSQTGDGAFCFFTEYNEAKYRLQAIDAYIRQTAPVAERVPQRIPYAMQPGVLSSSPRPLSDLPRVVLPGIVSPPAHAVQSSTPTAVLEAPTKKRKEMTPEQKKAAAERLAFARAKKKEKAQ